MTLTSGIINLFWGFIASATALGTIVGVVCLPITILPTILGIFEIIYAAKLLSAQPEPVQPSQNIAILEILTFLIGNIFSMVVGILALIFYNDVSVKEYFARLNNGKATVTPTPVPPAPATPESVVLQPEIPPAPVEPVIPEPVAPVTPEPVEDPAKPKRIRIVAGE
jgi:hypothetical protein